MTRLPALCFLLALIFGLSGVLRADDEFLRNGDFSRGSSGWKGDRKIQEEDGNKYLYIEAHKDEEQVVRQEKINAKDLEALVIRFRYRASPDYSGRGVAVRFVRPSGSSFQATLKVKPGGEWESVRGRFRGLRRMDEFTLELVVLPGEGGIAFDDISLKPLTAADEEGEDAVEQE
jgi:hypothetical protein